MEPLTPGRVTSRAGSPSLSHRAFPPFCPQPPHGAPSSLLCSPQLCQRDGLPVPFQISAFLMPLGVRQVWASHTPSRLAAPCSRNGFVILRTGGSPSVALHPALRQRSYFRFRVGGAYPEGTCTPLTLRLGGALGARPSGRSVRGVGWSRGVWQQGMIFFSVGAAALCNRRKGLQQKGSQHAQHRRGRAAAGRHAFFSKKGLKV